jgi:transposase-like protein
MGIVSRLFGKNKATTAVVESNDPPTCPHVTLTPRWDNIADMGNEDAVTSYICEGCHRSLSAEEGRALRRTEAERLHQGISTAE